MLNQFTHFDMISALLGFCFGLLFAVDQTKTLWGLIVAVVACAVGSVSGVFCAKLLIALVL